MYFLLLILAVLSMALFRNARAQEAPASDLIVESLTDETDVDFDFVARTAVGKNGIVVKQGNVILIADEGRVNLDTREVEAHGNVTLHGENLYWKGDHLQYNFNSKTIGASSFRAGI